MKNIALKLHLTASVITNPRMRWVDVLKIFIVIASGRPVYVKPKNILHPLRINDLPDIMYLVEVLLNETYRIKNIDNVRAIIDAGANRGVATVFLASAYPDAEICALEPEPRNFEILKSRCKEYKNVTCLQAGLCGHERKLKISDPSAKFDAFKISDKGKGVEVEGLTVPSVLQKMGWDWIDIFKMDIEGSEVEVFGENYESWINKVGFFFIEVHDSPSCPASVTVFRALERIEHGYYLRPQGENLTVQRMDLRKWD